MKSIIRYIRLLIVPFSFIMISCSDDDKYPDTTADETVIYNIRILNAGVDGNEIVVGTVNENTKEITFPEVHMETDLSKVRFDANVSDRAVLDSIEYNFVVPEGASQYKRTIAVVNGLRKREYYVTIRLDVPVWGADFTTSKVKVFDYTNAILKLEDYAVGSIDKPVYNTDATFGRQYGLSLQNVLIVNRNATGPGLVKLSDIKQGNIGNFTSLVGSDVSTEAWYSSGGVITNGHVYVSNGTPWGNTLYLRSWEENHPEVAPKIISYDYPVGPRRYDGFLSADINAEGNGFFFISGNTNVPENEKIVRFSVTGFSNKASVDLFPGPTPFTGTWAAINHVPGTSDDYIYSGWNSNNAPVRLVGANGSVKYSIPLDNISKTKGDVKIIVFNQERYLMAMDAEGTFFVYDITQGATTQAALELMNTGDPLFTYSLGGAVPTANASMSTAWIADGNETLYLLAGGVQAGFVVFEIPKKVKENQ